jgi:hypothetical protein
MSWKTEYFRSKEAADAASDRQRHRELYGDSTVRVVTRAQREKWLYGEDGPDEWGFDALVAGLSWDIKDAIADWNHRTMMVRCGYSDANEIPF